MNNEKLIEQIIKEEKRFYQNKWRKSHKERVKEYNIRYWRKRAENILKEKGGKQ